MRIQRTSSGVGAGVAIGDPIVSGTVGSVLFIDASTQLGQDNANFFWDDTNNRLGIGTATPSQQLHVKGGNLRFENTVVEDTETILNNGILDSRTTVSGDINHLGQQLDVKVSIASGVTDTGDARGLFNNVLRARVVGVNDDGTLTNVYGVSSHIGHSDKSVGASPTTTNMYGMYVIPITQTGTITNFYGMFLDEKNSAAATVTNYFGVYQKDAAAENYFAGNTGIGTTTPSSLLNVVASYTDESQQVFFNAGYSSFTATTSISPQESRSTHTDVNLDGNWIYGTRYTVQVKGTTTTTGRVQSLYSRPDIFGSGTIGIVAGVVSDPYIEAGSTSTISDVYAYWAPSGFDGSSGGAPVTTWAQMNISNPAAGDNKYGIRIRDITGGATSNYAIHSEGGTVYIGGNTGMGTTTPNQLLTVEGTASFKEQAAANADTAAYGQLWVKTATPNELYFTDDAGNDRELAYAGGAFHDGFSDFVANEHIDWTGSGAGTIHATNYVDTDTTDHTSLSNIGTNTHPQIDTHIANTANPHSVDIDDVTPTTTKGDIIVEDGSNAIRVAIGTNAQVLTADSAEASGVKWATSSGGGESTTVSDTSSLDLTLTGADITGTVLPAGVDHDSLNNFVANEHIDWTGASAGTIHASNYVDTDTTDHTALSNIGTNTHAQIDTHIADTTIHFTMLDEDTLVSDSNTQAATQQSIKAYVDGVVASSVNYQGGYNAATNTPDLDTSPSGISIGDMYTVTAAGTFFATALEIGDVLISEKDNPTLEADWTVVNKDLDAASIKVSYESNADTNAYTDAEQTVVGNTSNTNTGDQNDHGTLAGLTDDDHTQYPLLLGRATGQTLIGGTASGDDLTLQSTSNATKGTVFLGTASAYDEVNDRLGLGTLTPSTQIDMRNDGASSVVSMYSYRAAANHTKFDGYAARGSEATPAVLTDGDAIFELRGLGHDATGFINSARILFEVDGTPGTNDMPGRIAFETTADGASSVTRRMVIKEDGNVGIGTAAPQSLLDVQGAAGAAGTLTLSTKESTVVDGDILGRIDFNAPLESSGTDAILVGASIYAEADATFDATTNNTEIVFATGESEAATEKMRLTSDGVLLLTGTQPKQTITNAKFEIQGAAALDGTNPVTLTLANTTNSSSWVAGSNIQAIDFWSDDLSGSGAGVKSRIASQTYGTSGGGQGLAFSVDVGAGGGLIEVFRYDKDGRFQIATSAQTGAGKFNVFTGGTTEFLMQGTLIASATGNIFHIIDSASAETFVVDVNGVVEAGDGAVGKPGYTFNDDQDNGMYRITTDTLGFSTAGVERLRIDAAGNIGIGEAAPSKNLHITSADDTTLRFENTDTTQTSDQVSSTIEFVTNDASTGGTGITSYIKQLSTSVDGTGFGLTFGSSNSASLAEERMRIMGSGMVGIGNTAPADLFHVTGGDIRIENTFPSLILVDSDAAGTSTVGGVFRWQDSSAVVGFAIGPSSSNNIMFIDARDASGEISFRTGGLNDRVRIDSAGLMGVGTTAPQSLLDVQGAAGAAGLLTLSTAELTVVDGDELGRIDFNAPLESSGTDSILVAASIYAESEATFAVDNNTAGIVFATAESEVATEKMHLTGAGNLGIGTSAPDEMLHMQGTTAIKLRMERATSSGTGAQIVGAITRGTIASKTAAADNDSALFLNADAYVGATNEYERIAQLQFNVEGTPSDAVNGAAGEMVLKVSNGTDIISVFRVTSNRFLKVDTGGALLLGPTDAGTSATNTIAILNGTIPSASIANGCQIYAEDQASSSEIVARDEAGNLSTLTPHHFDLFEPSEDYYLPWSYHSENPYLGRKIDVDMYGAIEEIEKLSGKKFIHKKDIKQDSWKSSQEAHEKKHNDRVVVYKERIANLEKELEEAYDLEKESEIKDIKRIEPLTNYKKKAPRMWMQKRMEDSEYMFDS